MASSTSNFRAALFGIITLLAIVGNTLVAYVLIKRRKILLKNRATYQFILNLTISDLVIVVFFCPFEFTQELWGLWKFGTIMCKVVEYLQISASGTAVITHALIAMERYRSLAHPHLPRLKEKLVRQMIALSWIIPAIVSTPFLYMFQVKTSVGHQKAFQGTCTPFAIPVPWLDKCYEACEFLVMFFSPCCVICWCYYHIITLTIINPGEVQIPTAGRALQQSRKRVTKTSCLIVVAFLICWSPTFVLCIWRIASGTESIYQGHVLYEIALFGGLINEATNPVIYTTFDRNMTVGQSIGCCRQRICDSCLNEGTPSNQQSTEQNRLSCRASNRQLDFVN